MRARSLPAFLSASLHETANFALPLVFSSRQTLVTAPDFVESVLRLSSRAIALYSNHVTRKALFAQGSALLRLALSTYASANPRTCCCWTSATRSSSESERASTMLCSLA